MKKNDCSIPFITHIIGWGLVGIIILYFIKEGMEYPGWKLFLEGQGSLIGSILGSIVLAVTVYFTITKQTENIHKQIDAQEEHINLQIQADLKNRQEAEFFRRIDSASALIIGVSPLMMKSNTLVQDSKGGSKVKLEEFRAEYVLKVNQLGSHNRKLNIPGLLDLIKGYNKICTIFFILKSYELGINTFDFYKESLEKPIDPSVSDEVKIIIGSCKALVIVSGENATPVMLMDLYATSRRINHEIMHILDSAKYPSEL